MVKQSHYYLVPMDSTDSSQHWLCALLIQNFLLFFKKLASFSCEVWFWFIQKALAIRAGEYYDTRVQVPVDFSDEELLQYMKLAHERDMTFNELVEEALRHAIAEVEAGRLTKEDAQNWKLESQGKPWPFEKEERDEDKVGQWPTFGIFRLFY